MRFVCLCTLLTCLGLATVPAATEPLELPNPSFEEGSGDSPTGWQLSNGHGAWTEEYVAEGKHAIMVTGDGMDTNFWRSGPVNFKPETFYALRFKARRVNSLDGPPITGPVFANVDYFDLQNTWTELVNYFFTPRNLSEDICWIRFGQWRVDGSVAFDDVRLMEAHPVHRQTHGLTLGSGERLDGNRYHFDSPWTGTNVNYVRPLQWHNCFFNTSRFVFGKGSEVVFRHDLSGRNFTSASVNLSLTYHFNGALVVEASPDGEHWETLGALAETERSAAFQVPATLLPSTAVWIRLRADSENPLTFDSDMGSFAVTTYQMEGDVDGDPVSVTGETHFVEIEQNTTAFDIEVLDIGPARPSEENTLRLKLSPRGDGSEALPASVRTRIDVIPETGKRAQFTQRFDLTEAEQVLELPYVISNTGNVHLEVGVGGRKGYHARIDTFIPVLFEAAYGKRLSTADASLGLWWASSGWKISQDRALPLETDQSGGLLIRAARNETEAVQLVVRPQHDLEEVTLYTQGLEGPDGARIETADIDLLRVQYLDVQFPTDYSSTAAPWPSPLQPLEAPLTLKAGQNQPFWVRVNVPKSATPGLYEGIVELIAQDCVAQIPLRVQVYDFVLPDRMTCTTAMSLSWGRVRSYHGLKSEADEQKVLEKYLDNFSAHHISPYNPAPLDRFLVHWPDMAPGGDYDLDNIELTIDWAAWDQAMEKAIEDYHFNSFSMPVSGLGAGTFHSLRHGKLLDFTDDTPEYKALMREYLGQLETHLREKGWLDEAFVYWFDEPDPHQYEFVMDGFRKLKEYAPDMRRMLTEQFEPELAGGPNLWCPTSPHFSPENAEKRMELGETYWWYVCTVPKAPYATLFLDHAGIELRTWLWQTWERDIEGILIWTTNWWTSDAAYPNGLQNPYDDPMSWVSGYSTDAGQRQPWGNGDGRLIYPPLEAADAKPGNPVIKGPVESMRWEMLRDGIEDYEYFAILRRLLEQHGDKLSKGKRRAYEDLLEVPEAVTAGTTSFSLDPAPIEAHRHKLATAIEEITKEID